MQGNCNICGEFGRLTKDHVPPKGAVRITQMISLNMIDALSMEKPVKRPKGIIHQNGVTFPSLCGYCNNDVLGLRLDPEFNRFVSNIYKIISSSMRLSRTVNISCDLNRVARAFLGHMAAVGTFENSQFIREKLGDYILGKSSLPKDAKLYCWPFPYKNQTLLTFHSIAPDIAKFGYNGTLITWVMKFSPVAFMLVWRKPDTIPLGNLTCISDSLQLNKNEIDFKLNNIHQYWPESPRSHDIIMTDSMMPSITSTPYTTKKRTLN